MYCFTCDQNEIFVEIKIKKYATFLRSIGWIFVIISTIMLASILLIPTIANGNYDPGEYVFSRATSKFELIAHVIIKLLSELGYFLPFLFVVFGFFLSTAEQKVYKCRCGAIILRTSNFII